MHGFTYYPPPKFCFTVGVLGASVMGASTAALDSSFQEVSGIEAEFEVEELVEGGESRYAHRLPKRVKYPPLVCKRGIVTYGSPLGLWVGDCLGSKLATPIVAQNLYVALLGPDRVPLVAWALYNAWPLKWTVAPMDSMDNNVLTETMEFAYSYFLRTNLGIAV